jgi:DNA-binding CsgD family transcriptional regulator
MRGVQIASDFFEAAAQAETIDALQTALAQTLGELGVTHFGAFALVRDPDGPIHSQSLVRQTDDGWSQDYWEKRAHNYDAALHRALVQPGAFTFAEVESRPLSKNARDLFGVMREAMPIDAGYIVPVHDARHFAGLFGIYSAEHTIAEEIKPLLTMIALYATERAKALSEDAPMAVERCPLSGRQREMLAFAAQGKSDWDIAQIVGIAHSTVNEHIEKAKSALHVKTRSQAIAIAIHRGWILL